MSKNRGRHEESVAYKISGPCRSEEADMRM